MTSMVVLFSVMALAVGAPADIKITPLISYAAPIPQPAIVAAPTVYAAPTAYAAPALAAIAPAAVSSQSRVDIETKPGVVSTIASGPAVSAFASPIVYSAPVPSVYSPAVAAIPSVFRSAVAPVAVAPVVPIPTVQAPTVPAETPEVAAARAAHLEAKAAALKEAHSIQKRSPGVFFQQAPAITYSSSSSAVAYPTSHLVYSSPVAQVLPYSIHSPAVTTVF